MPGAAGTKLTIEQLQYKSKYSSNIQTDFTRGEQSSLLAGSSHRRHISAMGALLRTGAIRWVSDDPKLPHPLRELPELPDLTGAPMILAEMRGLVAVVVVGILIAVLFVRISEYGQDEEVSAATGPTTTTSTSSTTSTSAPPSAIVSALSGVRTLCESATEFIEASNTDIEYPGKTQQLAEEFYVKVNESVGAQVQLEFDAALRYYTEYNDLAEPYVYNGLDILRSDGGQRWALLAAGEPPGVEATRANVAFLCDGIEIPEPPLMSTRELDRLTDIVRKEQGN